MRSIQNGGHRDDARRPLVGRRVLVGRAHREATAWDAQHAVLEDGGWRWNGTAPSGSAVGGGGVIAFVAVGLGRCAVRRAGGAVGVPSRRPAPPDDGGAVLARRPGSAAAAAELRERLAIGDGAGDARADERASGIAPSRDELAAITSSTAS